MKPDTHVYIITKEGREYTDEGIKYLYDTFLEKEGITEPIFVMGQTINNPKALAAAIKGDKDGIYIIVSRRDGIMSIKQEVYDGLYENLIEDPNTSKTSYEILCESFGLEP